MKPAALLCVLVACLLSTGAVAQGPPAADGFDLRRLESIETLIREEIVAKKLPGAVVLVGRGDKVVWQTAVGNRSVEPAVELMTRDTIFDLASLTKVVATTTSAMILIEEGKIRLNDRVATYIPGFERYGKGDITIRHLMTHMSGLRPDVDLGDAWTGYDRAIELAIEEVLTAAPGERFVYSDIGYFLLGDIIRRVSGKPLDQFARERIFEPLGMKETGFNPDPSLAARIAPTERCTPYGWPCAPGPGEKVSILRGTVHDPTARRMAGVAGHAGLFSTADDLSIYARMLLNGGSWNGVRILSPLAVGPHDRSRRRRPASATCAAWAGTWTPPFRPIAVNCCRSARSATPAGPARRSGSILPRGMFVIFLSNRNHPDGKGDVTPLRARVTTIAASALTDVPPALLAETTSAGTDFGASGPAPVREDAPPVLTGIDVLRAEGFAILQGKRVGLITNHTGRARDGATTIDLHSPGQGGPARRALQPRARDPRHPRREGRRPRRTRRPAW